MAVFVLTLLLHVNHFVERKLNLLFTNHLRYKIDVVIRKI